MSAVMHAYNPLEAVKRLQQAGIAHQHAEAIAAEIHAGVGHLVTKPFCKDQLDAALNRMTIRLGIITAATVTVAYTILGIILSN